jgi:hypothetical protein
MKCSKLSRALPLRAQNVQPVAPSDGAWSYHARVSVDSPEDLYGLALDRFVPERAALVKTRRAEKRREEASEVAALRKPSVAAWVVNQLVRTQRKTLQSLFSAGDDLAQAQEQAAAGKGGGDAMREATHRQRDAVRELLEAAEGLLGSDGHGVSQATMERVGETLRAAANDEDARRQVAGGCLTRELRFVGVGIGLSTPSSVNREPTTIREKRTTPSPGTDKRPAGRRDRRKAKDETAPGAQEAEAIRNAEAERVAAREHAAAVKAARRAEAEARRTATRAEKELAAAQARQHEAAASLQEAETSLSVAAQRAEDAATKLTAAEQAVTDLARP